MYDQEDLTDVIDLIFEYNYYPRIGDIIGELGFTSPKTREIIDVLWSYGIIIVDENKCIIPLLKYEEAIILAQSIAAG